MWTLRDEEKQALLRADASTRVEYFVHKVVDAEAVCILAEGESGTVLAADDDGTVTVPVWPHGEYAAVLAVADWAGAEPEAVSLEDWLNYWTPGMQRDGRKVAIFPSPNGDAVVLEPDELANMLRAEDEAWYGGE